MQPHGHCGHYNWQKSYATGARFAIPPPNAHKQLCQCLVLIYPISPVLLFGLSCPWSKVTWPMYMPIPLELQPGHVSPSWAEHSVSCSVWLSHHMVTATNRPTAVPGAVYCSLMQLLLLLLETKGCDCGTSFVHTVTCNPQPQFCFSGVSAATPCLTDWCNFCCI